MTDHAEQVDINIKYVHIHPLVRSAKLLQSDPHVVAAVMQEDYIISNFISSLDHEIFSEAPEGIDANIWNKQKLGPFFEKILDTSRMHGYVAVQFYDDEKLPYKIFSEIHRNKWIYDAADNIVGMECRLSNLRDISKKNDAMMETIYFRETDEQLGDPRGKGTAYLYKFIEGDFVDIFSVSDITPALWNKTIFLRMIENQLDVMCQRPEFHVLLYGNHITPEQRSALKTFFDDSSIFQSLGISKQSLEEILTIKHETFTELTNRIEVLKEDIAGLTRLPLAFYKGQRTSGSGTGGPAEMAVDLKIIKKKQHLFNGFKSFMIEVLENEFGIPINDLKLAETLDSIDQQNESEKNDEKKFNRTDQSIDSGGKADTPTNADS